MRLIIGLALLAAVRTAEIKINDVDLIVKQLTGGSIDMSKKFVKAKAIIETYRQAPSCQRMALAELVNQSSANPTGPKNIEIMGQEIKELFAARLGLCELSSASKYSQPIAIKGCESMHPISCTKLQRFAAFRRATTTSDDSEQELCFQSVSRKQVQQCIASLGKRPQSWTSYSNALQNVNVVYNAVRASHEKDELLDTYRGMMHMNQQLMDAYNAALQNGEDFSTSAHQMQAQFTAEVQTGLASVHEEIERQTDSVRTAIARVLGDLLAQGGQLGRAIESLNEGTAQAAGTANQLLYNMVSVNTRARQATERMDTVNDQVANLQYNLSDVLNQASTASVQMEGLVQSQVRQYQIMTEFTEQAEEKLAQLSWTGVGAINPTLAAVMVGISAALTAIWPKALFLIGPACTLVILLHQAGVWIMLNLPRLLHLEAPSSITTLPADWPSLHTVYIVPSLGLILSLVAIAMLARRFASVRHSESSSLSVLPCALQPRRSERDQKITDVKLEGYY